MRSVNSLAGNTSDLCNILHSKVEYFLEYFLEYSSFYFKDFQQISYL